MRPVIVAVKIYWRSLRVMAWRAARCPKPRDRLSSPVSVTLSQLMIRTNEANNSCCYSYKEKSRLIVWRAARCLRPCDRLLSPLSVMPLYLRIRRNETSNSCCYSLPFKFEIDGLEISKMSEAL